MPRAPLARVLAQVRFPQILAIRNPDKVAVFQEALRDAYPNLTEDRVQRFDFAAEQPANVRDVVIWRLTDGEQNQHWRVSLGVDFVSLETSAYESRHDFLDRLRAVTGAVEDAFNPSEVKRLGLRYIDRLTGDAVERIADLVNPEVLGVMQPSKGVPTPIGDAIVHLMTEAELLADEGRIQARWGKLPPDATYDPNALEPVSEWSWILDLDMFTREPLPFARDEIHQKSNSFAERLYTVFREMVTEEFLRFYGGKP